eukprot:1160919-Pelagomonas_calceolata.AAC.5
MHHCRCPWPKIDRNHHLPGAHRSKRYALRNGDKGPQRVVPTSSSWAYEWWQRKSWREQAQKLPRGRLTPPQFILCFSIQPLTFRKSEDNSAGAQPVKVAAFKRTP